MSAMSTMSTMSAMSLATALDVSDATLRKLMTIRRHVPVRYATPGELSDYRAERESLRKGALGA